jgi:LysR family transcriptional regulator for bpeEF and oprC
MDKLRAIEYFVQTVEAGSMAAAARQLAVSPPAVTKMIAALERDLGTTLLRRDSRKLLLTPDGDRYLKTCGRLLADLRETEAALSARRSRARGRLVIGISRTVAAQCIVPRIADFRSRHPDLELEFRNVNYAHEPLAGLCDMLVLIGWQEDSDWIAQQVARGRHSAVATPAFWQQQGWPNDPDDLARYPCLGYRVPRGVVIDRWRFVRGSDVRQVAVKTPMVFDDRDALVEAALMGLGVHFGNDVTLMPWLRARRLQAALPAWVGQDTPPIHILYRRGGRGSAAVREFGDFVIRVFSDLMREREVFGPPDGGAMPDWFKARYVGRLADRKVDGSAPAPPA